MTQIEVLVVRRVHNRKIQIGAFDGDPADKVAVFVAQGSKPGTVGVDILPCRGRVAAVSIIDCRSANSLSVLRSSRNRLTSRPPLMRKIAAKTIIAKGCTADYGAFFCTSRSRAGDSPRRCPGRRRQQVPRRNLRQISDCIGCLYLKGRGLRQRCIAAVNLCHDGFSCNTILSLLYDLRGKKAREISHKNL